MDYRKNANPRKSRDEQQYQGHSPERPEPAGSQAPTGSHPLPYTHFARSKIGDARTWAILNIVIVGLIIIYYIFWGLYTSGILTSTKQLASYNDEGLVMCVFGGGPASENSSIMAGSLIYLIGLCIYLIGCILFLTAVLFEKKEDPGERACNVWLIQVYQLILPIPVFAVLSKFFAKINICYSEGMYWGYHLLEMGFTCIWLFVGYSVSSNYIKWVRDPEGVQHAHNEARKGSHPSGVSLLAPRKPPPHSTFDDSEFDMDVEAPMNR